MIGRKTLDLLRKTDQTAALGLDDPMAKIDFGLHPTPSSNLYTDIYVCIDNENSRTTWRFK